MKHNKGGAYSIHSNIIGRKLENGGNQITGVAKEIAPTLTKADRHAVCHVFKERGGCEGGGKGYLGSDELAFTVSTNPDQYVLHETGK
jgi:hypothetical protein